MRINIGKIQFYQKENDISYFTLNEKEMEVDEIKKAMYLITHILEVQQNLEDFYE